MYKVNFLYKAFSGFNLNNFISFITSIYLFPMESNLPQLTFLETPMCSIYNVMSAGSGLSASHGIQFRCRNDGRPWGLSLLAEHRDGQSSVEHNPQPCIRPVRATDGLPPPQAYLADHRRGTRYQPIVAKKACSVSFLI